VRRSLVALITLSCGCSYPEFGFAEQPAATDTAPPADTSVSDGGVDTAMDTTPTFETDVRPAAGCMGSTAAFCMDFSTSVFALDGWSGKNESPMTTLSIDKVLSYSAPNHLLTQTKADTAGYIAASVYRVMTAAAFNTDARIDVWIKLSAKPTGAGKHMLVRYQRDVVGDGLAFDVDATGFMLEAFGGSYSQRRTMKDVPIDTWFHVRIDARLQYVGGYARVWIDDMGTPAMELVDVSTVETDSLQRRLTVGIFASQTASDLTARYDDVSFAWK